MSDGGLAANHLPFERVDECCMATWRAATSWPRLDGAEVLLVFRGPEGYISPNWYPSKHETGREVPTWNYAVVHVHGRLRVVDDAAWLRALLETLTDRHEAGQPQPWQVGRCAGRPCREAAACGRRAGSRRSSGSRASSS